MDKQAIVASPIEPKKKLTKPLKILISLVALALVIGGGALAYQKLVTDQQPQNFVDQAFYKLLTYRKAFQIEATAGPAKEELSNPFFGAIKLKSQIIPADEKMSLEISADSLILDNSKIEVVADAKKEKAYLKLIISDDTANFFKGFGEGFLGESSAAQISNIVDKLTTTVNDNWFEISKEDFNKLNPSNTSSDLSKECSSSINSYAKFKVFEVVKELEKSDSQRIFEVKASKNRLNQSLEANPNDKCLQEFKKELDDFASQRSFDLYKNSFTVAISTKSNLPTQLVFKNDESSIEIYLNYAQQDRKIETPQEANSFSELNDLLEEIKNLYQDSLSEQLNSSLNQELDAEDFAL